MFYKATEESPRMFENDFVDGFSRIPWWMVPAVFVPISAGLLGWAAFGVHVAWYAMLVDLESGKIVNKTPTKDGEDVSVSALAAMGNFVVVARPWSIASFSVECVENQNGAR